MAIEVRETTVQPQASGASVVQLLLSDHADQEHARFRISISCPIDALPPGPALLAEYQFAALRLAERAIATAMDPLRKQLQSTDRPLPSAEPLPAAQRPSPRR